MTFQGDSQAHHPLDGQSSRSPFEVGNLDMRGSNPCRQVVLRKPKGPSVLADAIGKFHRPARLFHELAGTLYVLAMRNIVRPISKENGRGVCLNTWHHNIEA